MSDPPGPASAMRRAACRNCGRPAGPRFCGHCGQALDDRRRPLLGVLWEILADWLSVDGRLLRSLRALVRPGRLTLLHLDGKRAPYLRPFRLYLLASLALFSTVLTLRAPDAASVNLFIGGELISEATADGETRDIRLFRQDSVFGRRLQNSSAEQFESFRKLPPQQLLDSLFGSLRSYLPAALILFVPFLAAGLKLLYLRRKTLYVDHLVFALHFQSALFVALAASWLVTRPFRLGFDPTLPAYLVTGLLMLTIYLGLALYRVHPQSRWWTAARVLLLTYIYGKLLAFTLGVAVAAAILRSGT